MMNGNGWESNPPRRATRPDTGVEDREAHQDLAIPGLKHNFHTYACQLFLLDKNMGIFYGLFLLSGENGICLLPPLR